VNQDLYLLSKKIGYSFQNIQLFKAALTHRSVRGSNNERLEFLGDSIVNFVIAEELYKRLPSAKEGELSRLRANLVKGETLAELAREFNLGNYLNLGPGELKSGGFRRESILADAIEAIIGAIYLDGGIAQCQACVLKWYTDRLQQQALQLYIKDAKTKLQEYLQSRGLELPNYEVLSIQGEAHEQTFYVSCVVVSLAMNAEGMGSSRRKAEQEAAKNLLVLLEKPLL
jgi:ribonuclease-3